MPEVTSWGKLLLSPRISILGEHQGERVLVIVEVGDVAASHGGILLHIPGSDTSYVHSEAHEPFILGLMSIEPYISF